MSKNIFSNGTTEVYHGTATQSTPRPGRKRSCAQPDDRVICVWGRSAVVLVLLEYPAGIFRFALGETRQGIETASAILSTGSNVNTRIHGKESFVQAR